MSYHLNPEDFETLLNYLNSHLAVHLSGAIGPVRETPQQCYLPVHNAYRGVQQTRVSLTDHACMESRSLRGVQRIQESGPDRSAIVYDRGKQHRLSPNISLSLCLLRQRAQRQACRETYTLFRDTCLLFTFTDINNTWKLPNSFHAKQVFLWEQAFQRALVQETVFVVIEAFIEREGCDVLGYDPLALLAQFRAYLKTLTTHTITITMTSLVQDMIEECGISWNLTHTTETLMDFVKTRDCWLWEQGRLPSVEVTFEVPTLWRNRNSAGEIRLHCHYSWFPPRITFLHLQNVTTELGNFVLMPSVAKDPPFCYMSGVEINYYVGQQDTWLH